MGWTDIRRSRIGGFAVCGNHFKALGQSPRVGRRARILNPGWWPRCQGIVYSGNIDFADGPLFRGDPIVAIARAHKISVKPRKPWEKTVNYPQVTQGISAIFTGGTATGP
jgi:hypothetical protein